MSTPLVILGLFSIFFGYITKDLFIGLGSDFFSDNGIFIHPSHEIMLDTEFNLPTIFKLLPLFFTVTLSIVSIAITEIFPTYVIYFKNTFFGYNIFGFLNQRFAVELFYNRYISEVILTLGGQTSKVMDKGIVENFGPYGLQKKITDISKTINSLSTGIVTSYALYILIGLLSCLTITYMLNNNEEYLVAILLMLFVFNLKRLK